MVVRRQERQPYRQRWYPIIAKLLKEHGKADLPEIRKILRSSFPGGRNQRKVRTYSYRIWLDEARIQLGLKPRDLDPSHRQPKSCPGQLSLLP